MMEATGILQIVPRPPGNQDGVGDYALTLALNLRQRFGCDTIFATNGPGDGESEFELISPLSSVPRDKRFEHLILHYVNYGYQERGIPFGLLAIVRQLRQQCSGRLLTIFHELYASGPPWKSAFWLRPLQISIAKSISHLSDVCIVSGETMLSQLRKLAPQADLRVHPVPSNFGEPRLGHDQVAARSPHNWVICGGTILLERSFRSFLKIIGQLPKALAPEKLVLLGGNESVAIRSLLSGLPGIQTEYYPEIDALDASRVLSSSSFVWLDYFDQTNVPLDVILKSGAFAAACAHGVIPVFPHSGSAIANGDDVLPGPFFVDLDRQELPSATDRNGIALAIYEWYNRNASSQRLASAVAHALGLPERTNQ